MIDFSKYPAEKNTVILTPVNTEFEELYLKVREKEKRIYPDEEVIKLPFASDSNPHKDEWKLRAKSFIRFKKYLQAKNSKLNILDLGCGNGWFAGHLLKSFDHDFYCIDVNLEELMQAERLFNFPNIKFLYADIFVAEFPVLFFDLITINSAIQYFKSLDSLLNRLSILLKDDGEIHLIDSHIYSGAEKIKAELRSIEYYSSMGYPEMAGKYFHHAFDELSSFTYKILFNPSSLKSRFLNILNLKDSPFPWIVVKK